MLKKRRAHIRETNEWCSCRADADLARASADTLHYSELAYQIGVPDVEHEVVMARESLVHSEVHGEGVHHGR